MGTQSTTTPIYAPIHTLEAIGRRTMHYAAALVLVFSAVARAQTLPLLLSSAIAYDAHGNLYFADTANHIIGEFSAAGVLTTVAGNGTQGFSGDRGPATAAELDSPAGIALDTSGNLYIADTHNHRIREVAATTGLITTVAGTGVAGFSGDADPATAAQLDLPTALALDSSGNLYIADSNNHRIRRIAGGVITTVAGNGIEAFAGDGGPATAASIDSPNGVALDATGNLYLADTRNARVREVSATTGLIFTVAGTGFTRGNMQSFGGDGGAATSATLALPRGVTVDAAGNLYIADSANQRIRRIGTTAIITTVAGQGTEAFAGDAAPAVAANLDSPRSVAISTAGLLTLADTGNQRIRQIDTLPAPGPDIHTIPWSVGMVPDALSLTGPATTAYGSGTLTATLTSATNATGSVTFLDVTSATTLGTASLLATGPGSSTATFSAAALSAGANTITAAYTGDFNHAATQSSPLALTITQAPTLTALSASATNPNLGAAITLSMNAASTTSGVPTGTITLLDGNTTLTATPLANGAAVVTTSALALGTHSLTAAYSGDSNFLASTSATQNVVVGAVSDFTLTSAGATSQSVPAGNAATFSFTVATTGPALSSPILLSVQGTPLGATASISPSSLPPGGTVTSFTLTIQTPLARLEKPPLPPTPNQHFPSSILLAILLFPAAGLVRRASKTRRLLPVVFAAFVSFLLAMFATGCGNRINVSSESINSTSYTLTITGTATSPSGTTLQHSVNVTLQVL